MRRGIKETRSSKFQIRVREGMKFITEALELEKHLRLRG